jgi:hypothetical protein
MFFGGGNGHKMVEVTKRALTGRKARKYEENETSEGVTPNMNTSDVFDEVVLSSVSG